MRLAVEKDQYADPILCDALADRCGDRNPIADDYTALRHRLSLARAQPSSSICSTYEVVVAPVARQVRDVLFLPRSGHRSAVECHGKIAARAEHYRAAPVGERGAFVGLEHC